MAATLRPVTAPSTSRTVLVTGATGYIGNWLVPALVGAGFEVVASGRRSRPVWLPDGVDYRPADLVYGSLDHLLDGITDVVHLAGASSSRSDQAEMERANIDGSGRMAQAALAAGVVRFVHMSSTSVYGEEVLLPSPVTEDVELQPSRGYGKAKLGAEEAVRDVAAGEPEPGLELVILRPVTVYGPGAVKLLASVILDVAIERFAGVGTIEVPAAGIEQRLVHIDDLVGATIHVLGGPASAVAGRAFNVASGTYPSSHDVAAAVAAAFGAEAAVVDASECGLPLAEREAARAAMLDAGMQDRILFTLDRFRFMRKANRNNRVSIDALAEAGFRPAVTDFNAAVAASVGWYRDHGWIV